MDKNQNLVYAGWTGPNVESIGDSAFYNTTIPAKLEAGNLALEPEGQTHQPLFDEPVLVENEDYFNASRERQRGFELLRVRQNLLNQLLLKLNIEAFIDLAVDKPFYSKIDLVFNWNTNEFLVDFTSIIRWNSPRKRKWFETQYTKIGNHSIFPGCLSTLTPGYTYP